MGVGRATRRGWVGLGCKQKRVKDGWGGGEEKKERERNQKDEKKRWFYGGWMEVGKKGGDGLERKGMEGGRERGN